MLGKKNFIAQLSILYGLIINVGIAIIATFIALIIVEIGLRIFYAKEQSVIFVNGISDKDYDGSVRQPITQLFIPNVTIETTTKLGDEVLFQSIYSTNSFGGRYHSPVLNSRKKHLIFFGCSFVFGHGVNDNQTIPFYLNQSIRFQPYNLGVPAGGMHNMLAILRFTPISEYVKEPEGLAVYLMYPQIHLGRAVGKLNSVYFGLKNPEFRLSEAGLQFQGSFLERRPIVMGSLFQLVRHTRLVPLLLSSLQSEIIDKDYSLALAMVKESQELYKQKFPRGKFIVVVVDTIPEVEDWFRKEKINFIKVSDLSEQENFIPHDGHYSPLGNQRMAMAILKEMRREKIFE